MKFVAAILSVLVIGQTASADMTKAQSALILAKSLSFAVDGSLEKQLLTSLLAGQSYEERVSLMDSGCVTAADADVSSCNFTIGVDNTNDEDNGWSTVYTLRVRQINGNIDMIKLETTAG